MLIFVVNIRTARTFRNLTHCLLSLSRLTDLGIYYITRCGICLLTIYHIPYIHFQRELRKVTSPKIYLSFLFSIYAYSYIIEYKYFHFKDKISGRVMGKSVKTCENTRLIFPADVNRESVDVIPLHKLKYCTFPYLQKDVQFTAYLKKFNCVIRNFLLIKRMLYGTNLGTEMLRALMHSVYVDVIGQQSMQCDFFLKILLV